MEEKPAIIERPEAPRFWQLFVERHVELFVRALAKLANLDFDSADLQKGENGIGEDRISEMLSALLREVCREMREELDIHIYEPAWERPKAPLSMSGLRDWEVRKRPDFTCVFPNERGGSHDNYEIPLHIECKIIGKDKGRQTKYKKHYVSNGIVRFDSESHKYGHGAHCGMMIGYLVGESVDIVQEAINRVVKKEVAGHGPLCVSPGSHRKVGESKNEFSRRLVEPQSFTLIHLWVDLRDNPFFRV